MEGVVGVVSGVVVEPVSGRVLEEVADVERDGGLWLRAGRVPDRVGDGLLGWRMLVAW